MYIYTYTYIIYVHLIHNLRYLLYAFILVATCRTQIEPTLCDQPWLRNRNPAGRTVAPRPEFGREDQRGRWYKQDNDRAAKG